MATDRNDELLNRLLVQGNEVLAVLGDIRDRLPTSPSVDVAGPVWAEAAQDVAPVDVEIREPVSSDPSPTVKITEPAKKAARKPATKRATIKET